MLKRELAKQRAREQLKFLEQCERFSPDKLDFFRQSFLAEEKAESTFGTQAYAWIGVNPPPETHSLNSLYNLYMEKGCVYGGKAVLEQHTENGVRPHIHILTKVGQNVRKNHIISRLAKIYDLKEQSIDVNISKNKMLIDKWERYIIGDKKENKLLNCEKDFNDREKNGIPHLISL